MNEQLTIIFAICSGILVILNIWQLFKKDRKGDQSDAVKSAIEFDGIKQEVGKINSTLAKIEVKLDELLDRIHTSELENAKFEEKLKTLFQRVEALEAKVETK